MDRLPHIMGIVNVTPDSFSDGGRFDGVEAAVAQARRLFEQGATILDIGGESTRPGAQEVGITEELRRTLPVVEALRLAFKDADEEPRISIDTRKAEVAKAAILAGADIWNDVSGLTFSDDSVNMAADLGCDVVIMHAQGTPENMQDDPSYTDVITDIFVWLGERIEACEDAGIDRDKIIVDPGIGFGKSLDDNLSIMKSLHVFKQLQTRLLFGASRKSFIGKLDGSRVDDRLGGSVASAVLAYQGGADIVRVHDVAETRQALIVAQFVANSQDGDA